MVAEPLGSPELTALAGEGEDLALRGNQHDHEGPLPRGEQGRGHRTGSPGGALTLFLVQLVEWVQVLGRFAILYLVDDLQLTCVAAYLHASLVPVGTGSLRAGG